ncbi:MAG TPA: SIS domain-containing protein [Caulobacterales bacterium]|nr:SIS domain-containing protein [Caulobacterales bacterium]
MTTAIAPESTRMFAEAAEAATAVERALAENASRMIALAARLRAKPPRAVLTCARGSSDHAATYARYLIETELGVLTSSAALSISSVYGAAPALNDVLYLVISQSGRSPDLIASAEAARKKGALVIALVNDVESPLADLSDETIALSAGPEKSVAATKSFIAALAAALHLVAEWRGSADLRRARAALGAHLRQAWEQDWSHAREHLREARNMFTIGRGVGLAAAQEAALKFKETCGLHAEAFSAAEVMHGPLALAGAGFPALFLAQSDATLASMIATAEAFAERGADVVFAGAAEAWEGALPCVSAHPAAEPILLAQSFYRMTNELAVARGFDPDRPPHLSKVTETV